MIHCVLIINNLGQPRLAKFYTPLDMQSQQALMKQVYSLLATRSSSQSNFLTLPELLQGPDGEESSVRVIYRLYATLNFVFIVDRQESELGILDLIQVFVEALDKCFANVCELDLVFGWEVLETVLEELIQGGMVLETSVQKIVDAVDDANNQKLSGHEGFSRNGNDGYAQLSRWAPAGMKFGWTQDPLSSASRTFSDAASAFRSYLPGR